MFQFSIAQNIIENTARINSGVRCVQRWLLKYGFKRGKKSGKIGLASHVVALRNHYLRSLLKNCNLESNSKLQESYLDESYSDQHYFRHDDSIYDPNDEQHFQ